MKPLLFLAASALVMATAACAPTGKAVGRAALDCPAVQGDLKRLSEAPDRKSCVYTTSLGDEVNLSLIPVTAGPQAALKPIEDQLQAEFAPPAAGAAQTADVDVDVDVDGDSVGGKIAKAQAKAEAKMEAKADKFEARMAKAKAKIAGQDYSDAEVAEREAEADAGDWDDEDDDHAPRHDRHADHAQFDAPGIHVRAHGDKADVNIFGVVHVNAGEDGAVVHVSRDVRLKGEALSPERRGFRATYILAKDNLKDGYKAVGYEAAGPKTGPLTVAVMRAKSGRDHDHIFRDVRRLVRKNGGV